MYTYLIIIGSIRHIYTITAFTHFSCIVLTKAGIVEKIVFQIYFLSTFTKYKQRENLTPFTQPI